MLSLVAAVETSELHSIVGVSFVHHPDSLGLVCFGFVYCLRSVLHVGTFLNWKMGCEFLRFVDHLYTMIMMDR